MQPATFWLAPGHDVAPTPGGTTQVVVNVMLLGSSPIVVRFVVKVDCTLLFVAGPGGTALALQLLLLTLAHRVASRATFETK
jgi:hypothetical protein